MICVREIKVFFLFWACLCCSACSPFKTEFTSHFHIYSTVNQESMVSIKDNLEGYYANIVPRYFPKGIDYPLSIFYFKNQTEAQNGIKAAGLDGDFAYYRGLYFGDVRAIYTYRMENNGEVQGWGTLFHEITHHLITLNYRNQPRWFSEGLSAFLGEYSRINKDGRLNLGRPNPWRAEILNDNIKKGMPIDIGHMMSLSNEAFDKWQPGKSFSWSLFFWIYSQGKLEAYLRNVRQKGYGVNVLEDTVAMPAAEINRALDLFISNAVIPMVSRKNTGMNKGVDPFLL